MLCWNGADPSRFCIEMDSHDWSAHGARADRIESMKRARAPFVAWLLMPLCLLPGGFKALLCLAWLGVATPCGSCAIEVAESSVASACCDACTRVGPAPLVGEHVDLGVGESSSRARTGTTTSNDEGRSAGSSEVEVSACDCCVACELAPRHKAPFEPGVDAPVARTNFTVVAVVGSEIESRATSPCSPPRERIPRGAPLPLRI